MRETKFRAWDKEKKVYFPGEGDLWEFSIIGETTMFDLLNQYSIEDYNNLIIEQFTGLQDKNGKDIYEGDKIKFSHYNNTIERIVEWDNETCGFSPFSVPIDYDEVYIDRRELEIVGNIHEGER